jgi:hypothetical protein
MNEQYIKCKGRPYVEQTVKEKPQTSFFGTLFSGRGESIDRDELFGFKGSTQVAQHIPGEESIASGKFYRPTVEKLRFLMIKINIGTDQKNNIEN